MPSDSQIQAIFTGTSLDQLATNAGATVVWRNLMDWSTQNNGTLPSIVGSSATVQTNSIGFLPARSFKTNGVKLDRLGNHYVFPISAGSTSGTVWFEGTAPAGSNVVCYLRYLDGSTSPQVQTVANGSGRFVATINSPWKKPFYRSAGNSSNLSDCHHEFSIMDVGFVIPTMGQSEMNIQYTSIWTSASDFTPSASTNSGLSATNGPGSPTGPWGCVVDLSSKNSNSHQPRRFIGVKPRPELMLGKGVWADGVNEMVLRLINDTGASVMLVNLARSGHTIDQLIFDRVTFSQSINLTGTGTGPYTYSVTLSDTAIRNKFTDRLTSTDASNLYVSGNYIHQIRPRTFSLDLGGGIVITDTPTSFSAGTLSGPGGITGTITYVASTSAGKGSISINFPSTPTSVNGTLTWQPKSETLESSSANKTSNLDGYGVIELVDDVAGFGLRYGWSMGIIWWVTGNITDGPNNNAIRSNVRCKI